MAGLFLRRLSAERVTTPGSLVDQTVLSISRKYDSLGRREFITSHSDADPDLSSSFADAVNQVQYTYTAFGALDKEYQEHHGKVDGSSLHVDYAYDDTTDSSYRGLSSVFTKGMRPKSIKYPNDRLVHYTYGTGGLDDALSRVAAIYNDNGSGSPGTTAYAAYKRAGDGRVVEEAFAEPDLKLTYIGAGTGTRDYSGFDRFGRVIWQRWLKTNGSAADRYFYGYDRNSNRRWRAERSSATTASGRDESYAYDRLNRLVGAKRGILPSGTYQAPYPGDVTGNGVVDGSDSSVITANLGNSSRRWASGDLDGNGLVNSDDSAIYAANEGTPTGSVAAGRAWTLDATGNWTAYKQDNNGDGYCTGAGDLDQARLHNKANEIYDATDAITEQSNPQQSQWANPAYDARGNMTTLPRPGDMTAVYTCAYDAWNRLTKVVAGQTTVAEYRYDGLNRRIRKYTDKSGDNWTVREYYYNVSWQTLQIDKETEDRTGGVEPAVADALNEQYVWSLRYVDAPILRDRDSDGDGDPDDGDLGKTDSGLDERLYYCTDAQMNVTALVTAAGTVVERYAYDPYGQPIFYDGSWGSRSVSNYGNAILYGGYYYDAETGFYHVRNRMYHAQIGRWLQRDPLRYVDGMGLYEYCRGNALGGQDPLGLGWVSDAWEWTKNTATGIWEGLSNIVPFSAVPQSTHALPGIGNIKAAREARDLKIRLEWEGKDPDEDPNYVRLAKAAGTINMSGKAEATWKKYFGDKDKTVKKKE